MIRIIDSEKIDMKEILNREIQSYVEYENIVRGIILEVRKNGDNALKDFALKFDKVELESLVVSDAEFEEAFNTIDPELKAVIEKSAANINNDLTKLTLLSFTLHWGKVD